MYLYTYGTYVVTLFLKLSRHLDRSVLHPHLCVSAPSLASHCSDLSTSFFFNVQTFQRSDVPTCSELSPFLSCSCAIFCTRQKLNPFFSNVSALFVKNIRSRGGVQSKGAFVTHRFARSVSAS